MPSPPAPRPRPFAGRSLRGLNCGVGAELVFIRRGALESGMVPDVGVPTRVGIASAEMTLGTCDGWAVAAVAG